MFKKMMMLIAILLISTTANATMFTDTVIFTADSDDMGEDYIDHGWGAVNILDGITDYVHWNHNFDILNMGNIISVL